MPGKKLAARYDIGSDNRMTKKRSDNFLKEFFLKNFERNFYLLSKIMSVRGPLTIEFPGPAVANAALIRVYLSLMEEAP